MQITQIVNTVFTSNTFILDNGGEDVFLVDLGDYEPVKEYVAIHGKRIGGVLLTHVHYDHIYGLPKLLAESPEVKIYTCANGVEALADDKINFSRYHEDPISITDANTHVLSDGDEFTIMETERVKVMETPGHNYSDLTYFIGDCMFTGDSYIPGVNVIKTLPKSDKKLAVKFYDELQRLGEHYHVYPGHGVIKPMKG